MSDIKKDILAAVGNTPLVQLNKVTQGTKARVLVKCEFMNPSGSLKDRVAKYMIEMAEKDGKLRPGFSIVEASTGNMGSALAMASPVRGYPFICCIPKEMTEERKHIMRMFGAEIRDTGSIYGKEGLVFVHREVARDMEESGENIWWARQFSNMANVLAHKETTGYEIIEQSGGEIDAFVASVGSGGTLMGVAEALREKLPDRKVRIVAVEPESSPMLSQGKSGYHAIQGISDGFVPELLDTQIYDDIVLVSDEEAIGMTHRLRREEGLFCGTSSGANVAACLKAAREMSAGLTIVTVLPDSADRYFSVEKYER